MSNTDIIIKDYENNVEYEYKDVSRLLATTLVITLNERVEDKCVKKISNE